MLGTRFEEASTAVRRTMMMLDAGVESTGGEENYGDRSREAVFYITCVITIKINKQLREVSRVIFLQLCETALPKQEVRVPFGHKYLR